MSGAKIKVEVKINTLNQCGKKDNLIITDLNLPLEYQEVNFNFTNIGGLKVTVLRISKCNQLFVPGSVLGTGVGIIGGLAVGVVQGMVVDFAKDAVRKVVCY